MKDYGTIVKCGCGWRGPFYLMLVPVRYPGNARCPACRAESSEDDCRPYAEPYPIPKDIVDALDAALRPAHATRSNFPGARRPPLNGGRS